MHITPHRLAAATVIPVGISLILAVLTITGPEDQKRVLSAGDFAGSQEILPDQSNNSLVKVAQATSPEDGVVDPKPFEYQVEGGDSLSSIAQKFNLKLETVLWANDLTAKSTIRPGQTIVILPVDGTLHTVAKGDTVSSIAQEYGVDSSVIAEYNGVDDPRYIHAGDKIIVPGGKEPAPKAKSVAQSSPAGQGGSSPSLSGKLTWPVGTHNITQKYSASHRGIDLGNGEQPPIFAAHDGVVEVAGVQQSWGKTVVIRGDDGLVTRYAHAAELYVSAGQRVAAGQTIAKVGNTGRVSGPTGLHLHFGVYKNGVAINPLPLLK